MCSITPSMPCSSKNTASQLPSLAVCLPARCLARRSWHLLCLAAAPQEVGGLLGDQPHGIAAHDSPELTPAIRWVSVLKTNPSSPLNSTTGFVAVKYLQQKPVPSEMIFLGANCSISCCNKTCAMVLGEQSCAYVTARKALEAPRLLPAFTLILPSLGQAPGWDG